nr:pentatricopeptide repeat-containing protein At1g63330-like [Tanacetum cinerariifolium]
MKFLQEERLQICAFVETHLKQNSIGRVGSKVFGQWEWISNLQHSPTSCRILVGWNPLLIKTMILRANITLDMQEFRGTVNSIEVENICSFGFQFTWTKSLKNPNCTTLKKLDRIMINEEFMMKFTKAFSVFLPYLISDHSPTVLVIKDGAPKKKKAFRFSNFINRKEEFLLTVKKEWEVNIQGTHIVKSICDDQGNRNEGEQVAEQFVKHFECFLGISRHVIPLNNDIFINTLFVEEAEVMVREVNDKEIKEALFDIDGDKASGPDGYSSKFFKKGWEVIGKDFCYDVKEFFSSDMINWIMQCIPSPKFSIFINRGTHGYFKGERGLRQGDPISPYLITFVIEVFNLIIKKNIAACSEFGYHFGCKELKLSHICFVDDLLVLCKGNKDSLLVIKKSIKEFGQMSGLTANLGNSIIFFGSIKEELSVQDCKILIDKVEDKINCWRNKSLSYAGRIQLIAYVLSSMQLYWASVYLLPNTVIKELDKLFKKFLWNVGDSATGKTRVAWKIVCRPKEKCGLGIKPLGKWNEVLLIRQFWKNLENKKSLWVEWVNIVKLKSKSVWTVQVENNDSWGWKTMMHIRDKIKDHVSYEVGMGNKISIWYDKWNSFGTIGDVISQRDLYDARLPMDARVFDLISDNMWKWPSEWKAWFDMRKSLPAVEWKSVIWFNQFIPKHGFILWLSIQKRLLTRDRMEKWNKGGQMLCGLCNTIRDSHEHLFFQCDFAKKLWKCSNLVVDLSVNRSFILPLMMPLIRASMLKVGILWHRGIHPDLVTFNTLLNGLVLEDRIVEAEIFFKKLIKKKLCEPNVVMYSTMIKGLCMIGNNVIAIQLLRLMDENACKPNVVTYSNIIDSLCKDKMVDDAFKLLKEMVFQQGISPDVITYNCLIDGLCNLGCWEEASKMLQEMLDVGISPDVQTFNILVDAFCKEGKVEEAENVIGIMLEKGIVPDIVTFNSLMDGYCLRGEMSKTKAMLFFQEMNEKGLKPNIATYNTMIQGLFRVGRCGDARKFLDEMHAKDVVVYTIPMNGASKCGKFDIARALFQDLPNKGLHPHARTYSVMISGLCREGLVGDAKELFLKMEKSDCLLDNITYRVLLQRYLKNNHYDDVEMLLQEMDGRGYSLDATTLSLLLDQIAGGSLNNTLLDLIGKLVPKELMDSPNFSPK